MPVKLEIVQKMSKKGAPYEVLIMNLGVVEGCPVTKWVFLTDIELALVKKSLASRSL